MIFGSKHVGNINWGWLAINDAANVLYIILLSASLPNGGVVLSPIVLRMTSATIPLQGLPQSSHILCQNKELFLSRSMNSVHPGIQTRVPRHLGNGIVSFVITGKQLQSDLHIRWDYQYAQCLCNTRLHTKYQTKATQYLLTWCVRFPYTQLYACWWP